MKHVSMIAALLMTAGLVGCESDAPKPTTTPVRPAVTDIRPFDAQAAQSPIYDLSTPIPVAPQPTTPDAVLVSATPTADVTSPKVTVTPVSNLASKAAAIPGTHIVKRGETLFSIAKSNYGDGKQWKKIALANPKISASHLKPGQTLVLP